MLGWAFFPGWDCTRRALYMVALHMQSLIHVLYYTCRVLYQARIALVGSCRWQELNMQSRIVLYLAGNAQAESYTWHEMHAQAILPGRYSTWVALHKQWGCIVAFGLDIQKKGTCC